MTEFSHSYVEKKRILIVGNGFLGSNLAEYLVSQNFEVGVIYRKKIDKHLLDPRIRYFQIQNSRFDLVSEFKPQIVINAAGSGIPSNYQIHPLLADSEINYLTKGLIEFWNKNDFDLIFFSSGGTIYGPNHSQPIKEDSELNPVSKYGELKKSQENILLENQKRNCKNLLILRISNVYHFGNPSRGPHGFIETCLTNFKNNKSITIYGENKITRDFIYLKDFLRVIELLTQTQFTKDIFNVGTGIGVELKEVLEYIFEFSGIMPKFEINHDAEEKILYNVLDNSKLKNSINIEFSSLKTNLAKYFLESTHNDIF